MSKILSLTTTSGQDYQVKIIGGLTFYKPKFKLDWYVSGPDICRMFGSANPQDNSKKIWKRNKESLKDNSIIIKIPTAKKEQKGSPKKRGGQSVPHLCNSNIQEVRCYNRVGAWFFASKIGTKDSDKFMMELFEFFDRLLNKKDKPVDWQQLRELGKIDRRSLTDAIKLFVEYAKVNGSKGADHYYNLITKKVYKVLFGIESKKIPDNFRDHLVKRELRILQLAEDDLSEFIYECMDKNYPYKDIYKNIDLMIKNYTPAVKKVLT